MAVQVRCPLCNKRFFDLLPSKPPNGAVAIFCRNCRKVVVIDLSAYSDSQAHSEPASHKAPEPHS